MDGRSLRSRLCLRRTICALLCLLRAGPVTAQSGADNLSAPLPSAEARADPEAEAEDVFLTIAERLARCRVTEDVGSGLTCPTAWDGVLCWPETQANSSRAQRCFHELNGILYNTTNTASRLCQANGQWANRTNYSNCQPVDYEQHAVLGAPSEAASIIYLVGYTCSLVSLAVATAVFRRFTELHCPRNIIHTNLFVTCLVTDALWILAFLLHTVLTAKTSISCVVLTLLHYFHLATFFWMFVEGHYLYRLVVRTFGVDRIRYYLYTLIGWGLPLAVTTTWALLSAFVAPRTSTAQQRSHEPRYDDIDISFTRGSHPQQSSQCPWLVSNEWDWIYITPSLLVLAFNTVFLARIMWVLITKLRSTNSAETQQYKKATKALLVLLPLLGLTYILVIAGPPSGTMHHVVYYVQAILISTQGLTVSMIYCFFNTEVQTTIRNHYRRWRAKSHLNAPSNNRMRHEATLRGLAQSRDASATELTSITAEDLETA